MSNIRVLKFSASWCGPCKSYAPKFEEAKKLLSDRALLVSVDIDEVPELVEKYGVRAVPTTIVLQNEEVVRTRVGILTSQDLVNIVNEVEAGI